MSHIIRGRKDDRFLDEKCESVKKRALYGSGKKEKAKAERSDGREQGLCKYQSTQNARRRAKQCLARLRPLPYSTAPLLLQLADNVLQDAAMTHVCALHGGIHTHQRRETDFFPVRANSTNAHVRGLR